MVSEKGDGVRLISRRGFEGMALAAPAGMSALGREADVAEPSACLVSELRKQLDDWLERIGAPWAAT